MPPRYVLVNRYLMCIFHQRVPGIQGMMLLFKITVHQQMCLRLLNDCQIFEMENNVFLLYVDARNLVCSLHCAWQKRGLWRQSSWVWHILGRHGALHVSPWSSFASGRLPYMVPVTWYSVFLALTQRKRWNRRGPGIIQLQLYSYLK